MRVTEIQIERFGVWQNLNLPLAGDGMSVFYGPNEAGKTTLMRFVRGVLFGFPSRLPEILGDAAARLPRAGSLKVDVDDQTFRVHRAAIGATRGELSLTGYDQPRSPSDWMHDTLRGVNEKLFENVFAIGLKELQELGTLSDEDVSQHIYGLSLGPEGRRLLDAWNQVHARKRHWLDLDNQSGRLIELIEAREELHGQLGNLRKQKALFATLASKKYQLERQISELKQKQSALEQELRGRSFIGRVHGPWRRVRELERDLKSVPVIEGFPDRGMAKLEKIETQLTGAAEARDRLLGDARQARQQAQQLRISPELQKNAAAMQGLIDQRVMLTDLQDRIRQAEERLAEEELQLEELRSQLGFNSTAMPLENIDTSAHAYQRMTELGRSLQQTRQQRRRWKSRRTRMQKLLEKRKQEYAAGIAPLNGQSIDEAMAATRNQLDSLKRIARLELHEAELEDRQIGIEDDLARIAPRMVLPRWVYAILSVFCVMGLALSISGAYTGLTHSGIAGAVYALLGLTCAGIAWAFKQQFEGDARQRIREIEMESRANLDELEQTRIKISKITGRTVEEEAASNSVVPRSLLSTIAEQEAKERSGTGARTVSSTDANATDTDDRWYYSGDGAAWTALPKSKRQRSFFRRMRRLPDQIYHGWSGFWSELARNFGALFYWLPADDDVERQKRLNQRLRRSEVLDDAEEIAEQAFGQLNLVQDVSRKLVELERLGRLRDGIVKLEQKAALISRRSVSCRREHRGAAAAWQQHLAQQQLPRGLKFSDAINQWQRLVEAQERRTAQKSTRQHLQNLQDLWNSWQQRVAELGHRLQAWEVDYSRPLDVFTAWERQLAQLASHRKQRRELRTRIRLKTREARGFQRTVEECRLQRNALFTQAGAAHRGEFLQRAELVARRADLERTLTRVRDDLAEICRGFEDLALVEEDLLQFEPLQNEQVIAEHREALDGFEQQLAAHYEQLGQLKQELLVLEQDTQASDLKWELARNQAAQTEAAESWWSLELASQIVDSMRTRYERTCQPRTLMEASKYLDRLTEGRYRNIWTPLGERHLLVDDQQGRSLPVDSLSSGTREQLFLAVRLAVVQDLGRQGIHLPMILDDVFVNFDHHRSELAANVLWDFARDGHQLLFFTCHQHLAQMFEEKGIGSVTLPRHSGNSLITEEARLAG